jgi:FdhD protein
MMPRRTTAQFPVTKVQDETIEEMSDVVAVEEPLEIRLSFEAGGKRTDKSISITMRTPGDDFELAAGFLYSEGIVRTGDDIHEISYCVGKEKLNQRYNIVNVRLRAGVTFDLERLTRHFYTTSSCGVCGKASIEALQTQNTVKIPAGSPVIDAEVIRRIPEVIREKQAVFDKTGGLHAAALLDISGKIVGIKEDVGRHNAMDKLIGERLLLKQLPLVENILAVSGRTSFEIMQKAIMAGVPVIAAVGAPSSLAVELAQEFGVTLLGFMRDDRFNIYNAPERIRVGSTRKKT